MVHHVGLLFLRISFGLTMAIAHGLPKLTKYSTIKDNFPDPVGLGNSASLALVIFAEFICSIMVVLGIKVKWASVPLIITMLVASFIIHAGDQWHKQEFALLYLYGFTAIMLLGPGKFAIEFKK